MSILRMNTRRSPQIAVTVEEYKRPKFKVTLESPKDAGETER